MEYYKELARRMRRRYLDSLGNEVLQKPEDVYSDCNQAATAIYDLLGLVKLDEDAQEYLQKKLSEYKNRAEAAEARAEKAEKKAKEEIERFKSIMRSEDIMIIPSKYPGCKSEWNLPKGGGIKVERKPTEKDMEYLDKWTRRSAITHGISDQRLMEICSAERDGRCVLLPCRIGTPVWSSCFCEIDENGEEYPSGPWEFSIAMMDEWGENWHLTKEAAEAELKGEQNG